MKKIKLNKVIEERKERTRKIKKKWRANNKDKVAGEKKRYKLKHPEKVIQQNKNYRINNKEKINKRTKEYLLNNEDKRIEALVRRLTWNKYGSARICSLCNSKEKVQHHHSKPYNVDNFIDLCSKCHKEVHSKND